MHDILDNTDVTKECTKHLYKKQFIAHVDLLKNKIKQKNEYLTWQIDILTQRMKNDQGGMSSICSCCSWQKNRILVKWKHKAWTTKRQEILWRLQLLVQDTKINPTCWKAVIQFDFRTDLKGLLSNSIDMWWKVHGQKVIMHVERFMLRMCSCIYHSSN